MFERGEEGFAYRLDPDGPWEELTVIRGYSEGRRRLIFGRRGPRYVGRRSCDPLAVCRRKRDGVLVLINPDLSFSEVGPSYG